MGVKDRKHFFNVGNNFLFDNPAIYQLDLEITVSNVIFEILKPGLSRLKPDQFKQSVFSFMDNPEMYNKMCHLNIMLTLALPDLTVSS